MNRQRKRPRRVKGQPASVSRRRKRRLPEPSRSQAMGGRRAGLRVRRRRRPTQLLQQQGAAARLLLFAVRRPAAPGRAEAAPHTSTGSGGGGACVAVPTGTVVNSKCCRRGSRADGGVSSDRLKESSGAVNDWHRVSCSRPRSECTWRSSDSGSRPQHVSRRTRSWLVIGGWARKASESMSRNWRRSSRRRVSRGSRSASCAAVSSRQR